MSSKKSVELHECQYWHVPKMALLPLVGLAFFGLLAYLNLFLLDWGWLDAEMVRVFVFSDIVLVYPYLAEYLFVSLAMISLAGFLKGGYGNLKGFEEKCLIFGLFWGLILGLILGLFLGLGSGLIVGLMEEFE